MNIFAGIGRPAGQFARHLLRPPLIPPIASTTFGALSWISAPVASSSARAPQMRPLLRSSPVTRCRCSSLSLPPVSARLSASVNCNTRCRGAPDDVVARQRVRRALTEAAALDPVHRRQEAQALTQQPVVDLRARTLDAALRPGQRPLVGWIDLAEAQPVAQRHFGAVRHAHTRLQRRADQRHPAKSPARQPAETLRGIAVDQRHRHPRAARRAPSPCRPGRRRSPAYTPQACGELIGRALFAAGLW